MAALDCALHSGPLRLDGGAVVANGVTAADARENANPGGLALYEAQDGAYPLLAAGDMLCRVAATADTDQATARCFTTGRLGSTRRPRPVSWARPAFTATPGCCMRSTTSTRTPPFSKRLASTSARLVRDVAPVSSYLVGVADGAASLIVVKADFTGHAALAIDDALPGVVFDAAFAFDEGVYVAGSDGTLYKVDVDLTTIDDNCWADSGEDAPACAATAALSALGAGAGRPAPHELRRHARVRHGGAVLGTGARRRADAGTVA